MYIAICDCLYETLHVDVFTWFQKNEHKTPIVLPSSIALYHNAARALSH